MDIMTDHVSNFYNRNLDLEWQRLDVPLQRIEFGSTVRLVDKFPQRGPCLRHRQRTGAVRAHAR